MQRADHERRQRRRRREELPPLAPNLQLRPRAGKAPLITPGSQRLDDRVGLATQVDCSGLAPWRGQREPARRWPCRMPAPSRGAACQRTAARRQHGSPTLHHWRLPAARAGGPETCTTAVGVGCLSGRPRVGARLPRWRRLEAAPAQAAARRPAATWLPWASATISRMLYTRHHEGKRASTGALLDGLAGALIVTCCERAPHAHPALRCSDTNTWTQLQVILGCSQLRLQRRQLFLPGRQLGQLGLLLS